MIEICDLVIRNATLVTASGRREVDICVRDGQFAALVERGSDVEAARQIDATGLFALPGLIDEHVHFRQPGLEHEEDWLTGTRAAVMGGVTTVLDMPNTIPPTDTVERARTKLGLAAGSAHCDFGVFGLLGTDLDLIDQLLVTDLIVGLKAFLGPTTGGLRAPDDSGLRRALVVAHELGFRVAFHAEDRATIEEAEARLQAAGRTDPGAHLDSRPVEAEVLAIDEIGRLVSETGSAGHILHLSGAPGLEAVERWRSGGADLTCEVTPHHALLERDVYERAGGMARVNPPIRGEPHAPALMSALAAGRIDCLASDHAPHLAGDKQRASIWDVPAGIPGVETMLPLMLDHVAAGRLSLERLVAATSERPARLWGLWPRKGAVAVGSDADLTLVDLAREGVIRAADLHGKNNATPFEGLPTSGAPVMTIVRGRIVMRDGELRGDAGYGRQVVRS